jgi:hypothetical protein
LDEPKILEAIELKASMRIFPFAGGNQPAG